LHVRDGREEYAVDFLNTRLDQIKLQVERFADYTPFVIKRERYYKKGQNDPELQRVVVFPGYVFVKTKNDIQTILNDFQGLIEGSEAIYDIQSYGGTKSDIKTEILMRESEQTLWESLLPKDDDSDFCIKASAVRFIKTQEKKDSKDSDEPFEIVSGPLLERKGDIVDIIRRKNKIIVNVGSSELFPYGREMAFAMTIVD